MGNQDSVAGSDTAKAIRALLRSRGFDTHDFEIDESPFHGFEDLPGWGDSVVTVRRRSTGEERLYTTGSEASWLASLLSDLEQGHFGKLAIDRQPAKPNVF